LDVVILPGLCIKFQQLFGHLLGCSCVLFCFFIFSCDETQGPVHLGKCNVTELHPQALSL
jgi:hypothetical protein